MSGTLTLGRFGENEARLYLERNGYTVADMNLRCGRLELDIVATSGEWLIFVEVKTRTVNASNRKNFGAPAAAVGYSKREKLREAAREYLACHPGIEEAAPRVRFDVIGIEALMLSDGNFAVASLSHIKDAFTATERRQRGRYYDD